MLTIIPNKEEFVLEVHNRLSVIYGSGIAYFHDLDPLSELVTTLLSHRTKNRDSAQAFQNLATPSAPGKTYVMLMWKILKCS